MSKTNQPLLWNKPSDSQLAKYSKGCTIENLYPPKSTIPGLCDVFNIDDVENVSDLHLQENSNMVRVIKSEIKCIDEENEKETLLREEEEMTKEVINKLLDLHENSFFPFHHAYEVVSNDSEDFNKMKLKVKYRFDCDENNDFSLVVVDRKKCLDICLLSKSQSNCSLWFKERFFRITCSSRAHRIKTRKDETDESLMKLVKQFINEKHQGTLTKDMLYGKRMEPKAKMYFEELTGLKVYEIGLFISMRQPFLACSPDGLIFNNNNCELLEINCPATCKDSKIINREEKMSFVPYLFYDEDGNLMLKESSVYYTQIELSMYILCISVCHFFVYSSVDHVHIKVQRDEKFLSSIVPKIETFYCDYFFPSLTKN